MQGVICFIWVQRIFPPQKQWRHQHPLFTVVIVTLKTSEGDEIRWRSPNFVTLQKNEFSRPRQCPRPKWLWTMPRPLPYRFQYQKKLWGVLKNVWRKKMFSAKSMTKLEALTVPSWPRCRWDGKRTVYSWMLTVSSDYCRVINLVTSWPRYHWEGKEACDTAGCL
jgi:hypothetical protein